MNPSFRSARRCLRPCSIASSVFAIAVSSFLWTSSAQGAGSMNFGAVVDSRSWGSGSLQSLNYRLGAQVDAVDGWRAGIRVGYLAVRGRHSASLSAPTDTRLFVSRRLFGSLESRLTVDLPTGYATQSESDMAITRSLQDVLLDLPVRSTGSSLRFSTALGGTYSPALDWTVGLGAAWQDPSTYQPIEQGPDYDQGSSYSFSGVAEYRPGDWTWRTRVRWAHSGSGSYGSTTIETTPGWTGDTMLLRRWTRTSGWLRFGFRQPSEYSNAEGMQLDAGRGNEQSLTLGAFLHASTKLAFDGSLSHARYLGRGARELGRSNRTELHTGAELRIDSKSSLRLDLSIYRGQFRESTEAAPSDSQSWKGTQLKLATVVRF